VIDKLIFQDLTPLMFLLLPVSIICYFVDDIFDKEKELTLGYQVVAVKYN